MSKICQEEIRMPYFYLATKVGVDSPFVVITKRSIISYHPSRNIKFIIIIKDSGRIERGYTNRTQIEEQTESLRLMENREVIQFYYEAKLNLEAIARKKSAEIAAAVGLPAEA